MLEEAKKRTLILQDRMRQAGIGKAVFTDESSIAYLAGFWGYLGIEFGRPSMLVVDAQDAPVVITPLMESEMVAEMTWVEDVQTWEDIGPRSWGRALANALGESPKEIWIERGTIPAIVRNHLDDTYPGVPLRDISPVLGAMRTIKTPFEIGVMKEAGQIAGAMMAAAHDSLREGAQEYESALAVIEAGSRKRGLLLDGQGLGPLRLADDPQPADPAERHRCLDGASPCQCQTLRKIRPGLFLFLQHGAVQAVQAGLRPHVPHRRCDRPGT